MATRSRIGIELPNGEVKSVYCHWDGSPFRRIPLLLEHYSEREKVEQLIELGSICSLRPRLAPNEGEVHQCCELINGKLYSKDNDAKDVTIAYARDMKQADFVTVNIEENREAFRIGDVEEYGYLFTLEKEWLYVKGEYPENSQFMKAKDFAKEDDNSQSNAY
jgi:nucleoside 2-deoxyribosyltransferase